MMHNSIWLSDTTNIDHSFINNKGEIIGGSYRPKFIVTGNVDSHENVVIDFSTIKKTLKKAIDDLDTGFDHKLWWINDESLGDISFTNDTVEIITPLITIRGPRNIVRVMENRNEFNQYLTTILNKEYNSVNVSLNTVMTTPFDMYPDMSTEPYQFRYSHGLRYSSSMGCQNIAHGHLSYLAAHSTHNRKTGAVFNEIIKTINNKIFVWNENTTITNDIIEIMYSCDRGNMFMRTNINNVIILPTETTIEHMTSWIGSYWEEQLLESGIKTLFVSEGLSKGSCLNMN